MVNDTEFNLHESEQDLTTFITCLEQSLRDSLDKHSPVLMQKIRERNRQPSSTTEIKTQKQKTRRREKIWHRYHEEHQCTAYQESLKEYETVLKSARKTKMSETILECGTNTKCLYTV